MDNASSRFPPLLGRLLGSLDGWVGEKKTKNAKENERQIKKRENRRLGSSGAVVRKRNEEIIHITINNKLAY